MGLPRISRFKVKTVWPQLIQRRIQKIEIERQEILIVNRTGRLVANGTFDRVITYLEAGGRLGNIGDRVQFQVSLGQALPEPLPPFDIELISDSYLFQTRSTEAILEQDFILTVGEGKPACSAGTMERLVFDCIIGRHHDRGLLKLIIPFPEPAVWPRNFEGVIAFDETIQDAVAVLSGRILGVIEYMIVGGRLGLLEIDQSFNVSPEEVSRFPTGRRWIQGQVTGYFWVQGTGNTWNLEVTYDYQCFGLQSQVLNCFRPITGDGLAIGRRIKAIGLIDNRKFRFFNTWKFPFRSGEASEVNVSVIDKTDRLIPKGLLMEVLFKVEAYHAAVDGTEGYCQWKVSDSRLIEGMRLETNLKDVKIDGILQVDQIRHEAVNQEMVVTIATTYHVQILSIHVSNLLEDESGGIPVMANVLTGEHCFSILKEATLHLNKDPLGIHRVRADFIQTDVQNKRGGMEVKGDLILNVTYLQQSGEIIEENKKIPFTHCFIWNELDDDDVVELRAKIEFDTYRLTGRQLEYQYLISFEARCYHRQEIKLKVLKTGGEDEIGLGADRTCLRPDDDLVCMVEQEIRLTQSGPREIAVKRIYIDSFRWRNALNAIFVEGSLVVELEYRNERKFLYQEQLVINFWEFISVFGGDRQLPQAGQQFLPRVEGATFTPLKVWPWRKGMVRAVIGLKLIRVGSDKRL